MIYMIKQEGLHQNRVNSSLVPPVTVKWAIQCNEPELSERGSSIREASKKSTTYKRVCIFCDKVSKYAKGKDVREKLIQCIDLRADKNIRKTALAKNDSKLRYCVTRFGSS